MLTNFNTFFFCVSICKSSCDDNDQDWKTNQHKWELTTIIFWFCVRFTSHCWKALLWQILRIWYIVNIASKLKLSTAEGNFLLGISSSSRNPPVSSSWLFRLFIRLQTLSSDIFQDGTITLLIWNFKKRKKNAFRADRNKK